MPDFCNTLDIIKSVNIKTSESRIGTVFSIFYGLSIVVNKSNPI